MPERQPGRPTEDEFIGAAVRFVQQDYKMETVHMANQWYIHVCEVPSGRAADVDIIRREQEAEGQRGEPESLGDFAIRQLSLYQKSRKH